ncbi:hypothetical protein YERSI8AC_40010 [Enterobacterales bacterium 8AC]|nr:hypothetical protein YERSI8AC_40010 [Enterobacterales bacterium 8AC]
MRGRSHGAEWDHAGFWRVTETGSGTALIRYAQATAGVGLQQWDIQRQLLLENRRLAKELVFVRQPGRQLKLAERCLLRNQFDLLAIQVITWPDLPVQGQLVVLLFKIEGERLIDRHERVTAALAEQRGLNWLRQEKQAAEQQYQLNEALIHDR